MLTFWMHEDFDPGDSIAHFIHTIDGEAAMDRAVSAPEDDLGLAYFILGEAAHWFPRIP